MANPNEDDLRVANELIADWGFFIGSDPEAAELTKRVVSALAAQRERLAPVVYELVMDGRSAKEIAAAIRSGNESQEE